MPYKNKEDRKKQKNKPVGSKEFTARMERQRARQKMDAKAKKKGGCKNLREEVMQPQNWPTSRTSDAEGGRIETEMTEKGFKSRRHKSNQTFGAKLRDAV